jgi:hypothetical protein
MTSPSIPRGRLRRDYRLTWVDDSGCTRGTVNPPITPARLAHAMFGGLAGTPIDAFVCTVGLNAGYTLSYPTEVDGMEFLVDRLEAGAVVGSADLWRRAENLRCLWRNGHDPVRIALDEAHRIGMDFWLQLRMNDWHHVDAAGEIYRIIGSRFYEEHPEYLLGAEGVAGWPESLQRSMMFFQDFAHDEVRRIRLETASEAMARYPRADGWEYDFMRCPGYFAFGRERENAHLMTDLIRRTREMLDDLGSKHGKSYGLSVRVPNTIDGTQRLGLDVHQWIEDDLVDVVIPSTFFAHDTEEDVGEWVELAAGTPVRIHPAIEEAYLTGATQGRDVAAHEIRESIMRPLTVEMIRAIAARHWAAGADGLYLFNFPGTPETYGYDNRPALPDIGSSLRLEYKDKCYVVMRRNDAFPNCFSLERSIPAALGEEPVRVSIQVADDLQAAGNRVASVQLRLLIEELTHLDEVIVTMNGNRLACDNELEAGRRAPGRKTWLVYDLTVSPPIQGDNVVEMKAVRAERLAGEIPLVVSDVELDVSYRYPDGRWRHPPGFNPRT